MTTTDHRTETDERYRSWAAAEHRRYRRSDAKRCPRVVAGLRCRAISGCICHRHHHLLDHPRMWRDPDGRHVLTAELYDAPGDEMTDFLHDLAELGLRATFGGYSPWNPGGTFLLIIRRDDR